MLSSGRHAVRSKLVEVQLEYFFVFLATSPQLEIFHFSSYCYWMASLFFQTCSLDMKSVTRNLRTSLNATKRLQRRKRWLFSKTYLLYFLCDLPFWAMSPFSPYIFCLIITFPWRAACFHVLFIFIESYIITCTFSTHGD